MAKWNEGVDGRGRKTYSLDGAPGVRIVDKNHPHPTPVWEDASDSAGPDPFDSGDLDAVKTHVESKYKKPVRA